jgi:membrane-associated phospholipid phosphatase
VVTLRWPTASLSANDSPDFQARLCLAAFKVGRRLLLPFRIITSVAALMLFHTLWESGGAIETKLMIPVVLMALLATYARAPRDLAFWAFYLTAFMAFVQIRTFADDTGMTVQVSYPIVADEMLLLGQLPSTWLQSHLSPTGAFHALEIACAVVYMSYFFAPHLTALVVWRVRPRLFPRVLLAIILTLHLGLLIHFLVPSAPPWLAGELGDGPHVTRLLRQQFDPAHYDQAARVAGDNDVAAMPSLHMALTVIVALTLAQFGTGWKYFGRAYAAAMGFSLVYLGEHYVIDLAVGSVLAVGAWNLLPRYVGFLGRVDAPAVLDRRGRAAAEARALTAEPPDRSAA